MTWTGPIKGNVKRKFFAKDRGESILDIQTGGPPIRLVLPGARLFPFSLPHNTEGAPSFAESAVLVHALGVKGGSRE